MNKITVISDSNSKSLKIKKFLIKKIKSNSIKRLNLVIVIGGDGFMLQTLKKNKKSKAKKCKFNYFDYVNTYSFVKSID